jgi:hypothetical protein
MRRMLADIISLIFMQGSGIALKQVNDKMPESHFDEIRI